LNTENKYYKVTGAKSSGSETSASETSDDEVSETSSIAFDFCDLSEDSFDEMYELDDLNDDFDYLNANDDYENDPLIYAQSTIKYKEFVYSFFCLVEKLKISKVSIAILFKFVKAILPNDNIIPKTYDRMLKVLTLNKIVKKKICSICYSECVNENNCGHCENNSELDFSIIFFDYSNELKQLIENYWHLILEYQSMLDMNLCSDIQNSKSFQLCHNSISLLLFTDGARFNKGKSGVVWAILAIVSNLPLIIRTASHNIIKILFINSSGFNFNMIFDKHLNALKTLLAKGLNIEKLNLTVTIFIHMVIADAPARAKICNSKQFNGQYGCLHCLNPGTRFGRNQFYLDTNHEIRTNAHYLATLRSIRRKGFEHFGIKGPTYIKWFEINS
jgi:hypothetical protein